MMLNSFWVSIQGLLTWLKKSICYLVLLDVLLSILKVLVIKCILGEILSEIIILWNCFAFFGSILMFGTMRYTDGS